jgi:hypothetical protein
LRYPEISLDVSVDRAFVDIVTARSMLGYGMVSASRVT